MGVSTPDIQTNPPTALKAKHDAMMPMQMWLVRHGETEWSASGQHTGRTDLPLTHEGQKHATEIGRFLSGRRFRLVLTSPPTEEMQRIAAWTNLSETTFVLPPAFNQADYCLRIFTPKQELPFAGHPTIGSAHAVIESGFAAPKNGRLRQECRAGLLDLYVDETESGKRIMVQAPPAKVSVIGDVAARILNRGLGAGFESNAPSLRVDMGVVWIVTNVEDASRVARLTPDMNVLTSLSAELEATGVTVFGRSDDGVSALHVRSFAPFQGVPEDPVCGSGNASVAAYLIHSKRIKEIGNEYLARQGMQVGRDGRICVRVDGDSILIGGYAVTCVDGNLRVK